MHDRIAQFLEIARRGHEVTDIEELTDLNERRRVEGILDTPVATVGFALVEPGPGGPLHFAFRVALGTVHDLKVAAALLNQNAGGVGGGALGAFYALAIDVDGDASDGDEATATLELELHTDVWGFDPAALAPAFEELLVHVKKEWLTRYLSEERQTLEEIVAGAVELA